MPANNVSLQVGIIPNLQAFLCAFACWDAFRFNMLDNVTLDKYRLNHITDVLIRVSRETICYQTQANFLFFCFSTPVCFRFAMFHVKQSPQIVTCTSPLV